MAERAEKIRGGSSKVELERMLKTKQEVGYAQILGDPTHLMFLA